MRPTRSTFSYHDNLLPPKNPIARPQFGWSEIGLVEKGTRTVDELEYSGTPDTLSIRARSGALRTGFKAKHERSGSNSALG